MADINISEATPQQLADIYKNDLLPLLEDWGFDSDSGGILESLFTRAMELLGVPLS